MSKILASAFLVSLLAACSSMGNGYGGMGMNQSSTSMGAAPASMPMGMTHKDSMRNGDGPN